MTRKEYLESLKTLTKEEAYAKQDHVHGYKTMTVTIHVPLNPEKPVHYVFCDVTGELFPLEALSTDETGHGRCMACWQRVGRSEEELVAAGELAPEEVEAA